MPCNSFLPPPVPALSGLPVQHEANRELVASLEPEHPGDWLVVSGDVSERISDVVSALGVLASRCPTVVLWRLCLPHADVVDGARYEEVSLGYPRERRRRASVPGPRRVRCGP